MDAKTGNVFGLRIDENLQLIGAVEKYVSILEIPFCNVTGFGEIEWIIFADEASEPLRRLQGPFQLIDLKGRCRYAGNILLSEFVCTISRHTDNGIQVLGGKLVDAEIRFLELTFTPLLLLEDDAKDSSQKDRKAVETPIEKKVSLAVKEEKQSDTSMDKRWANAVAESKRILEATSQRSNSELEIRPKLGDAVIHRQFGECRVLRIDDDHITLRKPDGRGVQLGLSILKFTSVAEDGKSRVYQVQVKPRS